MQSTGLVREITPHGAMSLFTVLRTPNEKRELIWSSIRAFQVSERRGKRSKGDEGDLLGMAFV